MSEALGERALAAPLDSVALSVHESKRGRRWKMDAKCADCPFATSGSGRFLRATLGASRWRGILRALRSDKHFLCHKTTRETGNGSNLVCAGSIEWQEKRGLSSQYQRICERVEWMFASKPDKPTGAASSTTPDTKSLEDSHAEETP